MSVNHQAVCHLWASGKKESAKGFNIYFDGRSLYSYGSHYLLGFRLLPATFLLNSTRYSVSTGKHQSYASRATHGRTFRIPNLTAYRWSLAILADYASGKGDKRQAQNAVAGMIRDLAPAIGGELWNGGVSRDALEMLADVADIPPAKARDMIDGAVRKAAAKAAGEARKGAAIERKNAIHGAGVPFADHVAFIAERVATLKTGSDYAKRNALHTLEYAGKEAGRLHRIAGKAGLADSTRAKLWRIVKAYRVAVADHRAKEDQRAALATFRNHKRGLRDSLATLATGEVPYDAHTTWSALRGQSRTLLASRHVTGALRVRLESLAAWGHERAESILVERARKEAEKQAANVIKWRAGESVPGFYCPSPHGGAMIRATGVERDASGAIVGGTLETSQGASVPLCHAIKAFRFVKLCKERGTAWHKNGVSVRVGYYSVDSISPAGDFVAGCHTFKWPEIVSLACALGVFEMPASDAAVIHS